MSKCLGVVMLALVLSSLPAWAATISNLTVGEFRRALRQAERTGEPVIFAANGTLTLNIHQNINSGHLILMAATNVTNITITSTSGGTNTSGTVTTNLGRLFNVWPGARLTIQGITLENSRSTNVGGAIRNRGTLVMRDCTLRGNTVTAINGTNGIDAADSTNIPEDGGSGVHGGTALGGAIYNNGYATLTRCKFENNSAIAGDGGAGGSGGNGLSGAFSGGDGGRGGNGGGAYGGAIYNAGTLVVAACTFANNRVVAGDGAEAGSPGEGAFFAGLRGSGGTGGFAGGGAISSRFRVNVRKTTFANNTAEAGASQTRGAERNNDGSDGIDGGGAAGGALFNTGSGGIVNSTFDGNSVTGGTGGSGTDGGFAGGDAGDGGSGLGGGVRNTGSLNINSCTLHGGRVTGGSSGTNGVGIVVGSAGKKGAEAGGNLSNGGGTVVLINSILASAASGGNSHGSISDGGGNISSDGSVRFTARRSLMWTDPQLLPLARKGGPTETMALRPGSPAINRGRADACQPRDQRGFLRAGICDSGAYEFLLLTIAGRITNSAGEGVGGIDVHADGPRLATAVTEPGGYYSFQRLPLGDYTVTPVDTNLTFTFTPLSREVELTGNTNGIDFLARPLITVSGRVETNGVAFPGVKVFAGASTSVFTDTDGKFTFRDLPTNAPITIRPELTNFVFQPPSTNVGLVISNIAGLLFEGTRTNTVQPLPPLALEATFQAAPGVDYVVETSTNLVHWTTVETRTASASGSVAVRREISALDPRRFYRIRPAPP